jgi:hypothetical protein
MDFMEVTNQRAPEPHIPGMPAMPGEVGEPQHPLDSDAARRLLSKVTEWWDEARDGHADNRRQQYIDADYRDGNQWKPDDASILIDRGQVPLTFPLIKQMRDWITGTERRTRIDWNVLPREEDDVQTAAVKKALLKYISDVNAIGFERSHQFDDAVDVGIGWMEECYSRDGHEEPITAGHVDWKTIWWDPFSRKANLRDCRYIHRAKFVDLDYAIAMFPDREAQLRAAAMQTLDPDSELLDLDAAVPMMFFSTHSEHTSMPGSAASYVIRSSMNGRVRSRQRVLLIETWYRQPTAVKLIAGDPEWDGLRYIPTDKDMKAALEGGAISLVDSVTEEMRLCMWTPGTLLKEQDSPYRHGRFPFTPCWGYRRHRDGMPYGVIRLVRDSQDEYNKRRSKALFLLSTNRVEYESGAFLQDDEEDMLEEYSRPDGRIRLAKGALQNSMVRVTSNSGLAQAEIALMQEAKDNIYETAGVTRENTGQDTNAASGKAILAKQQQGAVTTAELFDNYRMSIQFSGQKLLSLCEQFLTMPKVFRIMGPNGAAQWERINQLRVTDDGEAIFENDITRHAADFVVDEMDYRETVRMAMADQLFELLGRLDPQVALQLMDAAVELTDLPNKSMLAARIRAISGQPEPGAEDSPEAKAARDAAKQAQAEERDLAKQERMAGLRKTISEALRNEADASGRTVGAKEKALNVAAAVSQAPDLAPAADALTGAA